MTGLRGVLYKVRIDRSRAHLQDVLDRTDICEAEKARKLCHGACLHWNTWNKAAASST